MRQVRLATRASGPGGTFGDLLVLDSGWSCVTTERPNMFQHHCVPGGVYLCTYTDHPEHGLCYQLRTGPGTPAPDRSGILIHSANVWQELLGCVALGRIVTLFGRESLRPEMPPETTYGVTDSKETLRAFVEEMKGEPFELTIIR